MPSKFPGASYWELNNPVFQTDICVIGGGFTAVWTAWFLKQKLPKVNITLIDALTNGRAASTRNAGFLCYGSPSEVLADIETMGEDQAVELVRKRLEGLHLIKKIIPAERTEMQFHGGREFFPSSMESLWNKTEKNLPYLNDLLEAVIGFKPYSIGKADDPLKNGNCIHIKEEGSINPAALIYYLNKELRKKGVDIVEGTKIKKINSQGDSVNLHTDSGGIFHAKKVLVATNGFTSSLISKIPEIRPARNSVIVLKTSSPLKLKGSYHSNEGYIYFRNVGEYLLIGGGRNWFKEKEFTESMEVRVEIVNKLIDFAKNELFHPKYDFQALMSWSGIMGVGNEKSPVFKWTDQNILVAARLSGMGVALCPLLGKKASTELGKYFQ